MGLLGISIPPCLGLEKEKWGVDLFIFSTCTLLAPCITYYNIL